MTDSVDRLDTKLRILDTAERLFAQKGLGATSLREIIGEAGVNLAAVHYHFGNKEDLIEAVVVRRATRVNQDRLAMLDACEFAAGPTGPLPVEQVLEAFVAPTVRVAGDPSRGGRHIVRIISRLFTETSEMQTRLIQKHFGEVLRRFQAALIRAVPDRDVGDVLWKFYFSVGSMIFALNALDEIGELTGGKCDASDLDGLTHRLVNFLAAGFRS